MIKAFQFLFGNMIADYEVWSEIQSHIHDAKRLGNKQVSYQKGSFGDAKYFNSIMANRRKLQAEGYEVHQANMQGRELLLVQWMAQ
jgi:hypothetical protein